MHQSFKGIAKVNSLKMANAQLQQTQTLDLEVAGSSSMDEGRDMLEEVVMSSIPDLTDSSISNEEIIGLLNESDANLEPPPMKMSKLSEGEGQAKLNNELSERQDGPSQSKSSEAEDGVLYIDRFSTPAYTVNSEGGAILGNLGIIFLGNTFLDHHGMAFDKTKVMN